MLALEPLQLAHEPVILCVAYFRRIRNIIKIFVPPKRFPQRFHLVRYGARCCLSHQLPAYPQEGEPLYSGVFFLPAYVV